MSASRCPQCGATYLTDGDSCEARFDALLALDHSRQEPWGSRHGQAFAAFALQHPETHHGSLDRAWAALARIYVAGEPPGVVFRALVRERGATPVEWHVPARPERPTSAPTITIADLGQFDPSQYPERLVAWCRASLAAWGLDM